MEPKTWQVGSFRATVWNESETIVRGCLRLRGEPVACAEVLSRYGMDRAVRAVEALAPIMQRPAEAWDISKEPITDVVFVPRPGQLPMDAPVWIPDEPVAIDDDVDLIPVAMSVANAIWDACDPPGYNRVGAVDLRQPLYAFRRYPAPRDPENAWDSDQKLQRVVALSRLVHPTSAGFRYAVRVIGNFQSVSYEIIPGPVSGFGAMAWTSYPDSDWLTPAHLASLRELLRAFDDNPLDPKGRLSRALWYFEYASREAVVDVRIPMIATAAEACVTTNSDQSTAQFKNRIPMLANRLGLPFISNNGASKMWSLRSKVVHGQTSGGLDSTDQNLYRRLEDVIRATLRTAIVDPEFRSIFDSDQTINEQLPVVRKPRTRACQKCGATVHF